MAESKNFRYGPLLLWLFIVIMPTHGKKYVEAKKAVDSQKQYSVEEAVKLVKQTNYAKFDATVNIAIKTNANPEQRVFALAGALWWVG